MCQQRLDTMFPYWGDELAGYYGKLIDQDDKLSKINQSVLRYENNTQEYSKIVDDILAIVEGDIKKEESLDERLQRIELELKEVKTINLNKEKSDKSTQFENPEKTFVQEEKSLMTEHFFEKPLSTIKFGENKENKNIKPSNKTQIKSAYSQYFSDKQMPKMVSVDLTEDITEKKTIKHAKTRSMSDCIVEDHKKKK